VLESGSHAHYLPTGHLIYVAEDRLLGVPFDVDALQTRAGATVLVDDVADEVLTSSYDVSTGGTLIYLAASSKL